MAPATPFFSCKTQNSLKWHFCSQMDFLFLIQYQRIILRPLMFLESPIGKIAYRYWQNQLRVLAINYWCWRVCQCIHINYAYCWHLKSSTCIDKIAYWHRPNLLPELAKSPTSIGQIVHFQRFGLVWGQNGGFENMRGLRNMPRIMPLFSLS